MIYESLSEEECYLLALMQDESGIDLAEFCLVDDTDDGFSVNDGCFRAYPFQVSWWRNKSQRQIDSASRSCGKSLSIKLRSFVFPFLFSDEEMVITAPEQNHLKPVTDNVETLYRSNRLAREVLAKGQSGITHRPFMIKMANGSKIMEKIPQRDGRGVKGSHPVWLEQDEGQDYPEAGWEEIVETVKIQNPRARHRVHGVTRGVGDTFDEKATGQDSQWKVHRLPALLRPNWTEKEKQDKIKEYGGSTEAIGYRRNVLGLSGDMNAPLFVLARLAKCLAPDTPILTADNQYVRVDEITVGTKTPNDDIIEAIFTSYQDELLKLRIDGGTTYVTPEHRFFTDRGWIEAKDLTGDDLIFTKETLRALQQGDLEQQSADVLDELLACFQCGEGEVMRPLWREYDN